MKYRVGESEKVTKDGKDYRVWKVSEQAGFYLADGVEGEEAEALIDRIIASCSALAVKMDEKAEACADSEPKAVEDSTHPKQFYLLRKRTDEKIIIDKDVFRLGKDASCVDYCISDNPTISRNHADIIRKKDGFFVKDKDSLNHTFVDGKKLEPDRMVKIELGSLVQLADEVFELIQE